MEIIWNNKYFDYESYTFNKKNQQDFSSIYHFFLLFAVLYPVFLYKISNIKQWNLKYCNIKSVT